MTKTLWYHPFPDGFKPNFRSKHAKFDEKTESIYREVYDILIGNKEFTWYDKPIKKFRYRSFFSNTVPANFEEFRANVDYIQIVRYGDVLVSFAIGVTNNFGQSLLTVAIDGHWRGKYTNSALGRPTNLMPAIVTKIMKTRKISKKHPVSKKIIKTTKQFAKDPKSFRGQLLTIELPEPKSFGFSNDISDRELRSYLY